MRYFIIACLTFSSLTADAASPLSWNDCVSKAAAQNAEIKSSLLDLTADDYQVSAAWSGFYPQLSGVLSYNYGTGGSSQNFSNLGSPSTSFGITTGLGAGGNPASSYGASLLLTQNLFNGLQDKSKVSQAKANTQVAAATLTQTKSKVSFDLKSSFEGLLFAQDAVILAERIIQRRKQNMQLVQLRFEGGRENKGSLLLSRAYLDQAQYDRLQAFNSISVAQAQLARVIGEDGNASLKIVGPVPVREPPVSPPFEKLVEETPEHLQSIGKEQAAMASVSLAEGPFYPSLNLTGSTGWNDTVWFPENNHWSVGVSLSVPLFSGLRDYYSTKSAKASEVSASFNRTNGDRDLLSKLKQAYTHFIEAVEKAKVDESFLSAATVRAEVSRKKYDTGLLSFEEWDIIENDLIARENAALQSQKDRVIAEAAWEQAQGKGVIQ